VFLIANGCAKFGHNAIVHILIDVRIVVEQYRFHVCEVFVQLGNHDLGGVIFRILSEAF